MLFVSSYYSVIGNRNFILEVASVFVFSQPKINPGNIGYWSFSIRQLLDYVLLTKIVLFCFDGRNQELNRSSQYDGTNERHK